MTIKSRLVILSLTLITILSLATSGIPRVQAASLVNAIGAYDSNPWGTKAAIGTADPQINDGIFGFSWARATVQYNPPGSGTNYFAEIGWWKDITGIHVHVIAQWNGGRFEQSYSQQPAVGSSHNYVVLWNSSQNCYDLKYDGTVITCKPASLTLTRVFSGGEASSSSNAIGISNCLNNYYASTNGGGWMLYPSHYDEAAQGYWVHDFSAQSWQVGGHN